MNKNNRLFFSDTKKTKIGNKTIEHIDTRRHGWEENTGTWKIEIRKEKYARELQLFNKKSIENPKTKLADKWQIPGDRMFPDYLLPLPSSHSRQKTEQKFFFFQVF